MPCPFFEPTEPFEEGRWPGAPELPLGAPHDGMCRASPDCQQAAEHELRTLCNLGYAAGRCPRFRAGPEGDAVRFAVVAAGESAVRVAWLRERAHLPLGHGVLEYNIVDGAPMPADFPTGALLEHQALAYVRVFLRRRQQVKAQGPLAAPVRARAAVRGKRAAKAGAG